MVDVTLAPSVQLSPRSGLHLFSPHVVRYYGSYFKNSDLLIVMEYCGAGSVADIIRIRNKTVICRCARARARARVSVEVPAI